MGYWALLFTLSLPIGVLILGVAFKNLDEFAEALVYLFTPIGAAALSGEAREAAWAKLKLVLVAMAWGAATSGIHFWLKSRI